jgi:hypothetical protein
LQLTRGHWLELVIETAFDNFGVKFIRQMEITATHKGVPVKAYLDLIMPGAEMNSITVLEIKTPENQRITCANPF